MGMGTIFLRFATRFAAQGGVTPLGQSAYPPAPLEQAVRSHSPTPQNKSALLTVPSSTHKNEKRVTSLFPTLQNHKRLPLENYLSWNGLEFMNPFYLEWFDS